MQMRVARGPLSNFEQPARRTLRAIRIVASRFMAGSFAPSLGRRLQLLHANVTVADELLREVPSSVHLEGDAALVAQALLRVLELHESDPVDPCGDLRRVPHDACPELV